MLAKSSGKMLNVGVIGYGYWGPNVVRNFSASSHIKVAKICDIHLSARKKAKSSYPHVEILSDYTRVIKAKDIDVAAIITPVLTHYKIARQALENGKHIFVEKPFTENTQQAEILIRLAEKKNLKIMVDHTFIFTGAVRKIKEIIDQNHFGQLYYYDSTRVNLGLFQPDVNVIWDLASHDFSIIDFLIKNKPLAVTAHGRDHMNRGRENIAYIIAYFENNLIAHINVNWLSPVKVRMTLIGGEKKMLVWDDLQMDEKIKIYDKGVSIKNREGLYRLLVNYRNGDMHSPRVDTTEALKVEIEYFIDCILKNKIPINDGHAGLRVTKILGSISQSLKQNGKLIKIKDIQ